MDYNRFMLQTIAEMPEYSKQVEKLLSIDERKAVINYLAMHPKSGDLIRSSGGVRKLRWKRQGMGKSGGVRVIYYYHSDIMPLYLLTIFGKNEKSNLNKAERNLLARLVNELIKAWRSKS